jgi:hypothetical protein
VDDSFVQQHFLQWGHRIHPAAHEMSGLVPDDRLVDVQNFPSDVQVRIAHGQHRKRVLEMHIENLMKEGWKVDHPDQDVPRFTLAQVHKHPLARWNVRLYGNCESMSVPPLRFLLKGENKRF